MSIVSRPYNSAGRANHERIFGTTKSLRRRGTYVLSVAPREKKKLHRGLKEGVATHRVPRGTAPDSYDPPEIMYRGSMTRFREEIQRAYDSHPDERFRGHKVELPNL